MRTINKAFPITILVLIISVSGCNREPVRPPQPVINQVSINWLKNQYKGSAALIDTSVYIQGVVTLTPEKNNIPDFIAYIQDNTGGLALTIDGSNTLAEGSEVKIFCKGLEISDYNGLLQFGSVNLQSMSELVQLVADPIQPAGVTIDQLLNGEHIAELVSISNVEFTEKGSLAGSHSVSDCVNEISVYTRSDALFADDPLPEGNGTLTAVASTYYDPQLLLRDPTELNMTGERCKPFFEGIFRETFETLDYNDPVTDLQDWLNPMQEGDRQWITRDFDENTYIQASAYSSGLENMISWMITPQIDLSTANNPGLSFETKTGYNNGATLTVMISEDYDGSDTPWNSTWISLSPTLANGPADAYSDWVSSGTIDLSAYSGTIYIAFMYSGNDPAGTENDKTTTWQVDNVTVDEVVK